MNLPTAFMEVCEQHGHTLTEHCLHVQVATQMLTHYHGDQYTTLTASTAVNGTGQQEGSFQTPLGLHRVYKKIGDNTPVGTVFKGRQPVRHDGKGDRTALITDRILWLEGLEPGFNSGGEVDSRQRYIYIHGIGDESRLGQPNSQGCIHLGAAGLLPLFDAIPEGTLVLITEN
mgnify:FL=1